MSAIATAETATFLATTFNADSIATRLALHDIPANDDVAVNAKMLVKMEGVRTQAEVAVLAVNLSGGAITGETMTSLLRTAFPGSKVGDRHGPHYLSLARSSKLKGLDANLTIPKAVRKPSKAAIAKAEATLEAAKKLIADAEATKLAAAEVEVEVAPVAEPVTEAKKPAPRKRTPKKAPAEA